MLAWREMKGLPDLSFSRTPVTSALTASRLFDIFVSGVYGEKTGAVVSSPCH